MMTIAALHNGAPVFTVVPITPSHQTSTSCDFLKYFVTVNLQNKGSAPPGWRWHPSWPRAARVTSRRVFIPGTATAHAAGAVRVDSKQRCHGDRGTFGFYCSKSAVLASPMQGADQTWLKITRSPRGAAPPPAPSRPGGDVQAPANRTAAPSCC